MSRDPIYEEVPHMKVRAGDLQLASQNNSAILLGRDRQGGVNTGYGHEPASAALHMIVGRKGSDPSPVDDAASIYLSQKTDPDRQAATESIGQKTVARSGVIMRADCVRITAREDIKISVGKAYLTMTTGGKIVIDGEIQLGEGASDRIIKGDEFSRFWSTLTIPTPVGPSGFPPPLPQSVFSSRTVKVK